MANVWYTYNGVALTSPTSSALGHYADPYNPLDLPPRTMRLLFRDNCIPTVTNPFGGAFTQVSSSPNIWDYALPDMETPWFNYAIRNQPDLLEVLGANTAGATGFGYTFYNCPALTKVALFDTSSATDLAHMFEACAALVDIPFFDTSSATDTALMFCGCGSITEVPLYNLSHVTDTVRMFLSCRSLTSIPLFDLSSCTTTECMFQRCTNVETGIYDMYLRVSQQAVPPTTHSRMFNECGINTVSGSAELAQIPSGWK